MSFIAILDIISIFATIISIFILFTKWKQGLYPEIRYFFLGLLGLSFLYYLSLFIECAGFTSSFVKTEDLLGVMIPMFWVFIFNTFLQLIAKKEIESNEKKYRTLIENLGKIVTIVDKDENFRFANPIAHTIFGVPNGSQVDRNLKDFIKKELLAL